MKTRIIEIGVALALVMTLAHPASAQDTSWAGGVRGDGWPDGSVTADGDMIIFRRPGPKSAQGNPQLQLRFEYRDGQRMGGRAYYSQLSLDEYDCKARRFRNVRTAAFTGHNAEGASAQDNSLEAWKAAQPGTVDAKSMTVACGK